MPSEVNAYGGVARKPWRLAAALRPRPRPRPMPSEVNAYGGVAREP